MLLIVWAAMNLLHHIKKIFQNIPKKAISKNQAKEIRQQPSPLGEGFGHFLRCLCR